MALKQAKNEMETCQR